MTPADGCGLAHSAELLGEGLFGLRGFVATSDARSGFLAYSTCSLDLGACVRVILVMLACIITICP